MKRLSAEQALSCCDIAVGNDGDIIKAELISGISEAWQINNITFITRIEKNSTGKELVVVCSQGSGLAKAAKVLRKAAIAAGCNTARFHTSRPAQQRLLAQFNFIELERVYQMEL